MKLNIKKNETAVFAVGGLGEIGKNMYGVQFQDEIIVIDAGIKFPEDDLLGIDYVISDYSYLVQNKDKIKALVITHGHEDHTGSLPYLMKDLTKKVPIYGTKMTLGLIEGKFKEHRIKAKLCEVNPGDEMKIGNFVVDFFAVNHSIPGALGVFFQSPAGNVLHTGDFKLDQSPIDGVHTDFGALARFSKMGVDLMMSDSTNVERPGYTRSERSVGASFDALFRGCEERIIVTTFASNVDRIQQIINVAVRYGRRVAVTGRSMENAMKVSTALGYMNIPDGVLMDLNHIKSLPKNKVCIITTGSQGETMSALTRMAFNTHRQVEIQAGDRVILSASAIPGNENTVSRVINELFRKGVEVIYDRADMLHVSGHACQEELKIIHALTKPKYFIPVHGEQRMLQLHKDLALQMGMDRKNIVICDNGDAVEIGARSMKCVPGYAPAGEVFVDGYGVGDVGAVVLRDRKHLAEDGMVVVVLPISAQNGDLLAEPEIITRGFIYVKDSEELLQDLRNLTMSTAEAYRGKRGRDLNELKGAIRSAVSNYLFKATKRSPMVLPVITRL